MLACCTSTGCSGEMNRSDNRVVTSDGVILRLETVASNLIVPWSLAFAGRTLYVTERQGRLLRIPGENRQPEVVATIPDVYPRGEGGLMGLTFHPDHQSNAFLYVSYTYLDSTNTVGNRVVRYTLGEDGLKSAFIIVDGLPGSGVHNGCRIRFGPDGKLYITTGDAARKEIAQTLSSLGGKILRVNDDGTIPDDNPFPGSPVYSYGHRNPQGIDWHPASHHLFSPEHGPSGFDGPGGGDEINVVTPGQNYGWPLVHHKDTASGMISPLLEFTPAVAPGGASFYSRNEIPQFQSNLFVATLRGRHVLRVRLSPASPVRVLETERMLENRYGRVRDIIEGPDGSLYICTSNRDGRGTPSNDDDRIIRISKLKQ